MSKHVIPINDKWEHVEDASCPCGVSVVTDADGEMIYVHENFGKTRGPMKEPKESKSEKADIAAIKAQIDKLETYHNNLLDQVLENPEKFSSGMVQSLNNGILTRVDFLVKRLMFMESKIVF